jgi:hypothetical protein
MALLQGQVGPQTAGPVNLGTGTQPAVRLGQLGEVIKSDLHGRFYEQNYRGNLYTFGLSNTAAVAANAIATGLTATAQPLIGIYNPINSPVNLVLLQTTIVTSTIANTAVSPGGFMYVYSIGNASVSTGSAPINCKTFSVSSSFAKAFAVSTALTGLTNNLAVLRACGIAPFNAAGAATAVSLLQGITTDNVDGSIIVPPGGVVGVMAQVSSTTYSVSVGALWEEVPV